MPTPSQFGQELNDPEALTGAEVLIGGDATVSFRLPLSTLLSWISSQSGTSDTLNGLVFYKGLMGVAGADSSYLSGQDVSGLPVGTVAMVEVLGQGISFWRLEGIDDYSDIAPPASSNAGYVLPNTLTSPAKYWLRIS